MTSWLHWPPFVWLLVDALAAYRLTRLAVKDTLTAPLRRRLTDRYEGGWLLDLAFCAWCLSVWIGAGVVALTYLLPYAWSLVAFGLACSTVAGYLSDREF